MKNELWMTRKINMKGQKVPVFSVDSILASLSLPGQRGRLEIMTQGAL